jgi:hypothetical protein
MPLEALAARIGASALSQLFLFVSPTRDFGRIASDARRIFPNCRTVACTTAGEIGPEGYVEDRIIAVGLPAQRFASEILIAHPLHDLDGHALADRLVQKRVGLAARVPHFPNTFAFSLIDGMSLREDALLSGIAPGLGPMPLFGGSAGDGRRFERTFLACDGEVFEDAAILSIIATDCRAQVFSLDHMTPTETRMVVTRADPETRRVKEINAAPAAREYARIVGRDPDQLDTFTFAAHPVVVRLGDEHHVRAIQRVTEDGDLIFFSAVDEGMVLSVAHSEEMSAHLERELSALSTAGAPADILACDCILRRIEAEQCQKGRAVSDVLARHRVIGFSTYGEQIGPIHINHTMTGVALYPPPDGGEDR